MKRGPKSAAELSVVQGGFGQGRPPPSEGLTDRQAAIWRETVASEAAEFFATAALRGILADYCRHRESIEQISQAIDLFKPEWLKLDAGAKRFKTLLQMRELETRAATAMATKLRLTNQSRYTTQAAGTTQRNAVQGLKPWEA